MILVEDQSLPAKKIRRDLEFEFVPKLINDLGELACELASNGLLGRSSVADRRVYLITKKFSDDVTERATRYFSEHRDASSSPMEYEKFMNSVIEHIFTLMINLKFSRPPFDQWSGPLDSIKEKMLKRIKAEADILCSVPAQKVTIFQDIKNKVKTVWNDPVWSNVIANVIYALLVLLGGVLYLYKDYVFLLMQEKLP